MNPIAAKGAAPKIQSHERVSIPKYGLKTKYNITATTQAAIENINCLKDSPKYTLSV
jgi:hypothetical protein